MQFLDTKSRAYPLTLADVRALYPHTCWDDSGPSAELLAERNLAIVLPTARPASAGMIVTEGQPKLVDGIWHQTWTETPMSSEQRGAEVAAARAVARAAVKAEAARRILLVAPEWMQRNLTAQAAELPLIYPGTRGVDLPEPERSHFLAGQALWGRIKAIRAASNQIEERLEALGSAEDIDAFDIQAGWPEDA